MKKHGFYYLLSEVSNLFFKHLKPFNMAELEQGPWGELKGKMGNYVVTKRNGKTIVQKKSNGPAKFSQKQIDQHLKFTIAAEFFRPLRELVMVTFRKTKSSNGANLANGAFIESAISGQSPDFTIDYARVRMSKGSLPLPLEPAAGNVGTTINFTWKDNSILGSADATDGAVIVVHCPARNESFFMMNVAPRNSGRVSVDAIVFAGQEVHTWLAFLRADKKKSSDSIYTGKLTLRLPNQN
jgi:hypothetical protein